MQDTDEPSRPPRRKIESLRSPNWETQPIRRLKDISALSKRLQDAAQAIDTVSRRALHEADNVEYNLRETLRTLNDSLEAVRELIEYLHEDPSALIRGKGKPKGEK